MAAIEERANAFADYGLPNNIEGAIRYTYIYAATEQHKIDIEKACKWLKKELSKLAMKELKENFLENEFKIVMKSDIPKWIDDFRKTLEEDV